jgi:hypothetical protein
MDDDADCLEHIWQLRSVVLDRAAEVEYSCTRCGAMTVRTAGQPFPG